MNDLSAADLEEIDAVATTIGAEAVQTVLALQPREDDARKAEAEAQRQRDVDAALADSIEMVARHRARLGRKTCSAHDGAAVRKIFELLRGLAPGTEE